MDELAKLNFARKALAEAKSLDEIKQIKDIAIAVKAYARAKNLGKEMINEASEIEIRAIREMGRLIQEKQNAGEIAKPGGSGSNQYAIVPERNISTLPEIGITRKESSTSKNLASIPNEKFEEIINKHFDDKKPITKTSILRSIAEENKNYDIEIPKDIFRVIYADPPWQYSDIKAYKPEGSAINHYPTMSLMEICKMALPNTEENAVLFLWSTSPMLEDSFKVINAWGFKYKASFIWDKIKHNMGHYNSVRHEFLLIATKGSCMPENIKLFDSVQSIERTDKHSEKPEIFREIIETLYPNGNKIELFARRSIPGWSSYGNEII